MNRHLVVGGLIAVVSAAAAAMAVVACFTAPNNGTEPIASSSAPLTTVQGACSPDAANTTCFDAGDGWTTCMCGTGVTPCPPTGCPSYDGGKCTQPWCEARYPYDLQLDDAGSLSLGFCGFMSIQGNFSDQKVSGGVIVNISQTFIQQDLNAYGQPQYLLVSEFGANPISASYICAYLSAFTPALSLASAGVIVQAETLVPPSTSASFEIPSTADKYLCPLNGVGGQFAPSTCTAGTDAVNTAAASVGGGFTTMKVSQSTTGTCTGALPYYSSTNCTKLTTAPKYGDAGSTAGWQTTLSGAATSVTLGAVTDYICYLTEWDNQGYNSAGSEDHVWLDNSGTNWTLNKNNSYINVSATCIPYVQ